MPPRSSEPATTSSDHPSADADAAVRAAASASRERLAALVAAARRVLAALAADPSAVQTGPRVGAAGVESISVAAADDAMDVEKPKKTSTTPSTSTSSEKKQPHLVVALSDAVEDLVASRAALRASIKDLKVAEERSSSSSSAEKERQRRSAEAAALEPAVAALRDEVRRKNSAVAAMSDSLAALVSDVDSWRVAGPGAWPGTGAEE